MMSSQQTDLSPYIYSNFQEYLNAIRNNYGQRQKKISLQIWAQKLGYKNSRSLELVLSGQRQPTEKMLFNLYKELKNTTIEKKYIDLMVLKSKTLVKHKPVFDIEDQMTQLRPKKFEARYIQNEIFCRISEWYFLVVRQLAQTPEFKNDVRWIYEKLNKKVAESQIIAALAEWNNLAYDRTSLYTPEDIPSQAVRTFHKKMLHKAIESIDQTTVDQREFISITFRGNKKDMPLFKKRLREMREQINSEFSHEAANDVFQVCLNIFPHTKM